MSKSDIKQQALAGVTAIVAVLLVSAYFELLGWRIIEPGISLAEAWGPAYLFGALETAGGAVVLGLVFMLPCLIFRRGRRWIFTHPVLVWSVGASIFLIAMGALIMWAP